MEIYINFENDYVKDFSFSPLENGVVVSLDENEFEQFDTNYQAYQLIDGALVLDEQKQKEVWRKNKIALIREQREIECFPIINRGGLWYDTLTPEQIEELDKWYKAWLNATWTLSVPKKPKWL